MTGLFRDGSSDCHPMTMSVESASVDRVNFTISPQVVMVSGLRKGQISQVEHATWSQTGRGNHLAFSCQVLVAGEMVKSIFQNHNFILSCKYGASPQCSSIWVFFESNENPVAVFRDFKLQRSFWRSAAEKPEKIKIEKNKIQIV